MIRTIGPVGAGPGRAANRGGGAVMVAPSLPDQPDGGTSSPGAFGGAATTPIEPDHECRRHGSRRALGGLACARATRRRAPGLRRPARGAAAPARGRLPRRAVLGAACAGARSASCCAAACAASGPARAIPPRTCCPPRWRCCVTGCPRSSPFPTAGAAASRRARRDGGGLRRRAARPRAPRAGGRPAQAGRPGRRAGRADPAAPPRGRRAAPAPRLRLLHRAPPRPVLAGPRRLRRP